MSLEDVRAAVASTGYDMSRVHAIAGPVEETLPHQVLPELALIRLDTDFYQSTRAELEHLYPRLVAGGVMIIDDYGHFRGAREAVDEYFAATRIFLSRIDYTARLAIKDASGKL